MRRVKLILNIGPPASGKTTFSLKYVADNPYCVRVNRDDLRFMLKNAAVTSYKVEELINVVIHEAISEALNKRFDVIVDNTNLRLKYINEFINKYSDRADICFKIHDVEYETLLTRDNNRVKKVGEDVLNRMYKQFTDLKSNPEFIKLLDKHTLL